MSLQWWKEKFVNFNFPRLTIKAMPFLQKWLNQDVNLIGLEISDHAIKLLKIDASSDQPQIENFAIIPLPEGAVVKHEIKDPTTICKVLKETCKQSGIKTKDVALAIPRSLAVIKNISVDNRLNANEIESRAWIEASKFFPDLVKEIYLDFEISGPSTQDPSQLDIILVACRKELIQSYLEILRECNLNAKIIDIDSYALERALHQMIRQSPELETVALFNLSSSVITFIVVHHGSLAYSYDQNFDGHQLLSNAKAVPAKISSASQAQLNQQEIILSPGQPDPLKESLSLPLRHTMQFFYSSRPNIHIQQLILSGDCAGITSLDQFVEQEIGIKTIVANPFVGMKLASSIDKKNLEGSASSLMLCCGLTLSGNNTQQNQATQRDFNDNAN